MQTIHSLLRNAKLELIAEKALKTPMVKENVGLDIIVLLIHQSLCQLHLDSSLKVWAMKSKNRAELEHIRMIIELLNASIAYLAISARINKWNGLKYVKLVHTVRNNRRLNARNVLLEHFQMTLV